MPSTTLTMPSRSPLIPPGNLPVDTQQTVIISNGDVSAPHVHSGVGRSTVHMHQDGYAAGIVQGFNESTRQLLHQRLLITAISAACLLLALKLLGLAFSHTPIREFLYRTSTVGVLVGLIVFLYRYPQASLRQLRLIEGIGGITLTVDMAWVLIAETQTRLATGEIESLSVQFTTISFAFAIFIAVYGMFIPNNWQRTAVITFLSALAPAITAIGLRQYYPALQSLEGFPGFIAPTLTMMMAFIAAQAAHVVHQIRREMETARQYGQYELLEEIGQGARGVVYKAKHRLLKRPAAVKLIRSEIANEQSTIAEFEHEVQLSADLRHWNSVQIYDYGRTDDGTFYYVMEYLEGESLLDRIQSRGQLTNEETVNIVGQVCDGLQEAHKKGMVHRDIKPSNIFLAANIGAQDVVKILDFGLATMTNETTRMHRSSGTPSYMAPEQIRGETIDERSDIYALGCLIYECLSGQCLITGKSIGEVIDKHLQQSPSLEGLPESASGVRDIIAMCIEKNPNQRFPNVAALKESLERCV